MYLAFADDVAIRSDLGSGKGIACPEKDTIQRYSVMMFLVLVHFVQDVDFDPHCSGLPIKRLADAADLQVTFVRPLCRVATHRWLRTLPSFFRERCPERAARARTSG